MRSELCRNVKNICTAILTIVLVCGATGKTVLASWRSGPGNAIYTLAGTDASIRKIAEQ